MPQEPEDTGENGDLRAFKITNKKTGETFTINSSEEPTKEQIKNIENLRAKNKRAQEIVAAAEREAGQGWPRLAALVSAPSEYVEPKEMPQSEVEKLPAWERVKRLSRETLSGVLRPENLPYTAAALTGPLGATASAFALAPQMAYGTYQAAKEAIKNPTFETIARTGLQALGTGLSGLGVGKWLQGRYPLPAGTTEMPQVSPPGPQLPQLQPVPERLALNPKPTLQLPGQKQLPAYQAPQLLEAPSPAQLPPAQMITPPPPERLGLPPKGPLITPPPEGSVPTTRRFVKGGPIVTPPSSGLTTNIPAPIDQPITAPPAPESIAKPDIRTQLIPPDETMILEPEHVSSPKTSDMPALENTWLREQDTEALKQIQPGASGKLRTEIDTVLGERGFVSEQSSKLEVKAPGEVTEKISEETWNSWDSAKRREYIRKNKVTGSINPWKSWEEIPEEVRNKISKVEEEPETSQIDETLYSQYNSQLKSLLSLDKIDQQRLRDVAELGQKAGLDQETIVNNLGEHAPKINNIANRAYQATNRLFKKGESGFVSLESLFGRASDEAEGTEAKEPIENAKKELGILDRSLPKPESVVGRMGESGAKLERMIEDAQYESDSLKGQLDLLAHDSFKGLTPREIGQRIAILNNGDEIPTNKGNFDKYVDWRAGTFKPTKGVQKIIRMRGSLWDVVNNGATPKNEKIAAAAKNFNQAMNILGTEGENSGVSTVVSDGKYIPFEKMDKYWPRDYTNGFYESLKKNPKDWDRIVQDVAKEKNITVAEAEKLLHDAQNYKELTTRGQHERLFKQDSSVIDPESVMDHIRAFSGRIGMAKALGPEDIRGSLVGDELTKLMNEGFDSKFASDTIARLVGRESAKDIPTKNERRIYQAVVGINNARLMTSFLINNLANVTTTIARVGPVTTLKGLGAYLGNMEVARRMAILSGAAEHTGTIEGSRMSISKMIGVPTSERFMRTWADQAGRIALWTELDRIQNMKESSPEFIRSKNLIDSFLGKDSSETIKRGVPLLEETQRAGWQLSKDTQGIINPATMPPFFENVKNPALRIFGNLAMQYKRMSLLGMNSLRESFKLNPTRTIATMSVAAPIIGEVLGDAGNALFGALSGTITQEGAVKAAIRDINQRGESLRKMLKPILQDKIGLSEKHAFAVSRYIEDTNRGFALGLIGDFVYSVAYWGGQAGADIVSGGISPAFELVYDVAKDIMNIAIPKTGHTAQEGVMNLIQDLLPQRLGTSLYRSEKSTKSSGELLVRPPSLPNL